MTWRRVRWNAWDWGLVGVSAVAVLLRLPYLTSRSLWYDEASSWQTAIFPFPEMFKSVRLNVHMPFYYILLKGWMAVLGDSLASLRGFSILFSVLTVVLMDLFALELYRASASGNESEQGRRGFALVVAGLVAVSPFQVLGSIEARMYSLGTAFTALSSWLLLRILRERGQTWMWWPYGAASVGLLYSHHFGLFTVAAQYVFLFLDVVWLLGLGERTRAWTVLKNAAAVGLLISLAYLPGLFLLRTQTNRVEQGYWLPELTWRKFSGTFSEFLIPTHGFDFVIGGWSVFAVAALSCAIIAVRGRRGDGFVLASALLPMFASAAISSVQPLWLARYFRFAHLFLLAAVALAIWRVTRKVPVLRGLLIALLFAVQLGANVLFWEYLDIPHGPGVRGGIETIMARRQGDEMIVTFDHHQYFPAKYYVGTEARIRLVDPGPGLFWGWHLIRPNDLITVEELRGELRRGVWLIGNGAPPKSFPGVESATLLEQYLFTYYQSLHRRLFVQHYKVADNSEVQKEAEP
jgi:mannosyltransferase